MNFAKLKKLTPKARRLRRLEEEQKAYERETQECESINSKIMATLLEQCPEGHLIVTERNVGWTQSFSFEDDVKVFLDEMLPEEDMRKDYDTCRMCYNPANCKKYNPMYLAKQASFNGRLHNDYIVRWKFVPYPEWWK